MVFDRTMPAFLQAVLHRDHTRTGPSFWFCSCTGSKYVNTQALGLSRLKSLHPKDIQLHSFHGRWTN